MRFRTKLAMASAAAALMAGTAFAQSTTITLTETGNAAGFVTGDNGAFITLSTQAATNQTGDLQFTIMPADMEFGLGTMGAGNVVIELTGAEFNDVIGVNAVAPFGTAGTTEACIDTPSNDVNVTGGAFGGTQATFTISGIDECDGATDDQMADTDGTVGPDNGDEVLQFTLPIALTPGGLANGANFKVTINGAGASVIAAKTEYDANPGTPGIQQVVQVQNPFAVAMAAEGTSDTTLALGSNPPFSDFISSPDTDPDNLNDGDGILGELTITDNSVFPTITSLGGSQVNQDSLTVTVDFTNVTGIAAVDLIDDSTATTVPLSQVGTTNRFSATLTSGGTVDLDPFVTDGGSETSTIQVTITGTDSVDRQTPEGGFDFAANNGFSTSGSEVALDSIDRDGQTRRFRWVALESANAENAFRIVGLDPMSPERVLVTLRQINTGDAAITDQEIQGLPTFLSALRPGGEVVLTGRQLATMVGLDTSAPGVTRGEVVFTIEANNVEVDRAWITANGGIDSANGDLKSNQ